MLPVQTARMVKARGGVAGGGGGGVVVTAGPVRTMCARDGGGGVRCVGSGGRVCGGPVCGGFALGQE